ncbi:hypothetical protein [Nostoc sp. UHCC 0870]|uniref:hypothetical protein n=1 Tax=Nostoc sp. UHCC 0870 TaxID=2914041 RepID=UPI0030D9768B
MNIWQENQLLFSVQSQPALTCTELLQSLILACGGSINPSYFQFLDMEISECLYHLYVFIDLNKKQKPSPENKLHEWGMTGGIEFGE